MTKFGLLMIACAGIAAAPGCLSDSPAADVDQTQTAESEVGVTPDDNTQDFLGVFRVIQLSNTQLCVQPKGGSTEDVEVELAPCRFSDPIQNWDIRRMTSTEWEVVNAATGKCLYNGAPLPMFNGARPITHESCNIFGTDSPASNALWRPQTTRGLTRLMSRIQHRDSNFCFDVPNGNPFPGVTMWMWGCNGTPAQTWLVGTN